MAGMDQGWGMGCVRSRQGHQKAKVYTQMNLAIANLETLTLLGVLFRERFINIKLT